MPGLSEAGIHLVNMVVRKAAHLTEYGILAALLWRTIRNTHAGKTHFWSWADAGWTLLIVALYAASDEFHQSFVPTREASVRDVLIDCTGALLALLCLWSLGRWRKSR
jgi:VanZ family protein